MGSSFSIFGNNSNTDNDTNINENIGTSKPSLRPTTPILGTIPKILDIPEIIIEECEEDILEDIQEENKNTKNTKKTNLDINLNLLENNIVVESNLQLNDNGVNSGDICEDSDDSDDSDDNESNSKLNYDELNDDLNEKYDNLNDKYTYLHNEYYSLSKTYLESKTKILSLEKMVIKLKYIKNKTNNKLELSNLENNMINNKMNTIHSTFRIFILVSHIIFFNFEIDI